MSVEAVYTCFLNGFDSRTLLQNQKPPDCNNQAVSLYLQGLHPLRKSELHRN
nr:MAG TPA: hypothetical protein [Caudoviricetes sp.]